MLERLRIGGGDRGIGSPAGCEGRACQVDGIGEIVDGLGGMGFTEARGLAKNNSWKDQVVGYHRCEAIIR